MEGCLAGESKVTIGEGAKTDYGKMKQQRIWKIISMKNGGGGRFRVYGWGQTSGVTLRSCTSFFPNHFFDIIFKLTNFGWFQNSNINYQLKMVTLR